MSATITHVLGARPNFVKAAPVIRALAALGHAQRVVHTGQHYDERMSDVFFVQLGLPEPDVNLGVGSGTQATQTADVLVGMEREFLENSPSLVVLYGDVNSTVGAALAGAKLGVPLAHVEAGLRSFDNTMPEEINRRLTDQLCDLLFCTSPEALGHLAREGRPGQRHAPGRQPDDRHADRQPGQVRRRRGPRRLRPRQTAGTSSPPCTGPPTSTRPSGPAELVRALHEVAAELDVIIPLHPRGRATLTAAGLLSPRESPAGSTDRVSPGGASDVRSPRIHVVEPLGYVEFMSLVRGAAAIVTDSGGVQEETTLLRVPCLTLRPNTERPITITSGSNRLVTRDELAAAVLKACDDGPYAGELPPLWDGHAGPRIARIITSWLAQR